AGDGLDLLAGNPARAEQDRPIALEADDGALESDGAGAAIEHAGDAALEGVDDVARFGRADGAGGVRARRSKRPATGAEELQREAVARNAHGERLKPGARNPRDGAIRCSRQDEGE